MRTALLCIIASLCGAVPIQAQNGRVVAAGAEFRAQPDGALLATVDSGTIVGTGERRRAWTEAVLEGWIWAPSVREDERMGHDLSVAVDGGENLRAEPNGPVLARLREGMLLDRLEARGRWIRVRRTGWMSADAVEVQRARTDADAARAEPASAPASAAVPVRAGGWVSAGQRGTAVFAAPDGDTLALLRPLATLEVIERDENWARVRLEGWVWTPSLAVPSDSGTVLEDATVEAVRANPAAFRGRLVEWTVQFIALDHAEAIRTDLRAGEPFILARPTGDRPGFVYLAVPADLLERVERLTPLEDITVLARVRTGRSQLMDAPVLDLLDLR